MWWLMFRTKTVSIDLGLVNIIVSMWIFNSCYLKHLYYYGISVFMKKTNPPICQCVHPRRISDRWIGFPDGHSRSTIYLIVIEGAGGYDGC